MAKEKKRRKKKADGGNVSYGEEDSLSGRSDLYYDEQELSTSRRLEEGDDTESAHASRAQLNNKTEEQLEQALLE